MRQALRTLFAAGFLAGTSFSWGFDASSYGDGLYAVFETNAGEFTAQLFFEDVPMTVANFVGLAEGTHPWLKEGTTQIVTEPFYDGLTFHRTIVDFMIQGGSQNGQGTDDPGYAFADEIDPDHFHSSAGVLSMANSGRNSNGSQFFITVVPTDWLDGKHAVFGEIVEGLSNVVAISEMPVESDGSTPVTPMVMQSVTIVREGTAAQAFDASAWHVPELSRLEVALETYPYQDEVITIVSYPYEQSYFYQLFSTNEFDEWFLTKDDFFIGSGTWRIEVGSAAPADGGLFIWGIQHNLGLQEDMTGASLVINLNGLDPFTCSFTDSFSGEFTQGGSTGDISYYAWNVTGNGVQLYLPDDLGTLGQSQVHMKFETATSGTVFARVFSDGDDTLRTGTFTLTLPAGE